jgi:hypothetical protein
MKDIKMEYPKMTHEDYESAISVKPKATPPWKPPTIVSPTPPKPHVVPNWVKTPAKPIPGSVPFKQEYEAKYNKPIPAGIPVEVDPNKGTGPENFCLTDIISTCTCPGLKKVWADHIGCKYSIKSSKADRCMYFVQGKFCDCLEAQKAAGIKIKSLTDCMGL